MTRRTLFFWLITSVVIAVPSVTLNAAWNQAGAQDAKPKVFKLKGVVQAVDTTNRKITVKHEDIPGFMAAMTMPYRVGKSEDLKKVTPGDAIQADVVVGNGSADLENIKVNGHHGLGGK